MTKFCKDCKYFSNGYYADWCKSPNFEDDIVTGEKLITIAQWCRSESRLCGLNAAWFEPKPEKVSFWKRLFKS